MGAPTGPFWLRALGQIARLPLALLAGLTPRRRDLWVFGAWYGRRYADNSSYLFEHVSRHEPDIRAVWMTRDQATLARLRTQGLCARLIGTWSGYWTCARAGAAFLSVASDDVNFAGAWAAKLIQLWHGSPLKRILADDPTLQQRRQPWLYRQMVRLGRRVRFLSPRWDVVISAAEGVSPRLASAFGATARSVAVTGQPRGDVILAADPPKLAVVEDMKARCGAQRVICYVPTHREEGRQSADLLGGLDAAALDACLQRNGAVLLVKMHFHQARDAGRDLGPRVHWLAEHEAPDVNRLLPHVDLLITDYSSVYFDYLLLDRPMVFAPFDLEQYLQTPGIYGRYEDVAPGPICRDWPQVLAAIDQALAGPDCYADARRRVNEQFNQYVDTQNCRRVVELARDLVGLPDPTEGQPCGS